ncbi:MAG: hypothetical protein ACRD18_00420 [Terriglobia bacterium]
MPNSKRTVSLPDCIRDFVERQVTLPLASLFEDGVTPVHPCGEYWRRAVAAVLLSGRIAAKSDGFPNMTDVNRICKEVDFDQYLFEATGRFLVTAKIIRPNVRSSQYEPAKFSDAFWNHQLRPLQETARQAFLELVQQFTPFRAWRPTPAVSSTLDGLVALFATAFADLAIPVDKVGNVLLDFSKLPYQDLIDLGKRLGLKKHQCNAGGWDSWLDERGQQALVSALYVSSWAYTVVHQKQRWICLSDTARIILGLVAPPELPAPVVDLKVLPNLCVLAGADLPPDKLVPLFRHCKIKRIDRVIEFQLDKRQLRETTSLKPLAWNLREVLEESGPLPATVDSLLGQRPAGGGEIRIRTCSAIVQPESADVLDAIRQHSRLKGYLEARAPAGYLLIKQQSNPSNFIQRCKELGFNVTLLQS